MVIVIVEPIGRSVVPEIVGVVLVADAPAVMRIVGAVLSCSTVAVSVAVVLLAVTDADAVNVPSTKPDKFKPATLQVPSFCTVALPTTFDVPLSVSDTVSVTVLPTAFAVVPEIVTELSSASFRIPLAIGSLIVTVWVPVGNKHCGA